MFLTQANLILVYFYFVKHFSRFYLSEVFIIYIFCVCLEFGGCYITDHWGEFKVKNDTFCSHVFFWLFFSFLFFIKKCVSIIFISYFGNRTHDEKLSVELYEKHYSIAVELYEKHYSIAIYLICFSSEIQTYSYWRNRYIFEGLSQLTITCSKLTKATLEQGVVDVVLMSSLLTLNIFHISF